MEAKAGEERKKTLTQNPRGNKRHDFFQVTEKSVRQECRVYKEMGRGIVDITREEGRAPLCRTRKATFKSLDFT